MLRLKRKKKSNAKLPAAEVLGLSGVCLSKRAPENFLLEMYRRLAGMAGRAAVAIGFACLVALSQEASGQVALAKQTPSSQAVSSHRSDKQAVGGDAPAVNSRANKRSSRSNKSKERTSAKSPRRGERNESTAKRKKGSKRNPHKLPEKEIVEKKQKSHAKRGTPESDLPNQEVDSVQKCLNEQLSRAYVLYDAGVNQRLLGNYGAAVSQLTEARQLFHTGRQRISATSEAADPDAQASPPENSKRSQPMEILALFELARAADEGKNYQVAKQSYQECISLAAEFLPAYLRLSCLEARQGQAEEALRVARRASGLAPTDPRPHALASHLLLELGMPIEAGAEEQKCSNLTQKCRVASPEQVQETNN